MIKGKTARELLTKAEDRISCLYIEKANIEQTDYSVAIIQGHNSSELPITTINALFLGPGTTITQQAVKNLCDAGVTIIWCGAEAWRFYAIGQAGTISSKNLLRQIKCHESKTLHLEIVKKMYKLRYPQDHLSRKTIAELRGVEGKHVKELYAALSKKYGVEWIGRNYDHTDYDSQNDINKALTSSNQILYGIVRGVLHLMGFSPAIGFIHTGNMESFVYDIADLYKESISIPTSFRVVAENDEDLDKRIREEMRDEIIKRHLMKQIPKDLKCLFGELDTDIKDVDFGLWNYNTIVSYGKNYS